ncbi:MAG: hypothetical protein LBE12_02380 [Planctomycetaceae bacterium]|jgi:hypothetical protein|nr:hypothetical protein [Planctomycetaceae bacterium]
MELGQMTGCHSAHCGIKVTSSPAFGFSDVQQRNKRNYQIVVGQTDPK